MKLNGTLGCEACSVDFFETYGELGREFAECHHLVPLSELREKRGSPNWESSARTPSNAASSQTVENH